MIEKRQFGQTDMQVSVLGFGGAEIGFHQVPPEQVGRLLNQALDDGLNVIDTAECYLQSEELIGKAVSHRRKDFYLFTKCGHPEGMEHADWSFASLLKSIERSLKRLRTDYLDLIQLHSCELEELKKGEVIRALEEAKRKGYARCLGYSGDSQAARFAVESGRFDTLQTSLSIADQEAIEFTLPLARERGLGIIAKRPIANAAWRTGKKPANAYHHAYWERLQKLDYPFLHDSLERSVATALRFTYSIQGIHTMIVGSTQPGRWKENAGLLAAGPLPEAEVQAIRKRWKQVADPSWAGEV
ncbi:MAG TPA: aldo/keto reductase [Terriglobales bacterium]|jgi:aryl-alcohol dehydrogenase-like predicted oxidoreductase|nr:aldo/keto reductase [Terriglobales bacterium]